MELLLPSGKKKKIEATATLEEKMKIVEELLIEFKDEIEEAWETDKIKFFLDSLSNLLCWHKDDEEKGKEDRYINSRFKEEKANGKRKTNVLPFTSLNNTQKGKLGIGGLTDNGENV